MAVDQAREAVEKSPSYPQAWLNLGMAIGKYRDFSGEIDALERGLKVAPGSVPLLA